MKFSLHLFFLLSLAGLSTTPANAQQALTYSLNDCIQFALNNQLSLKQANLDYQLRLENNKEILGIAKPQIKANGQFQYLFVIPKQRADANAFNFGSAFSFFQIDTPKYLEYLAQPREKYSELKFGLPLSATAGVQASQILFDAGVFIAIQARRDLEKLSILNTRRTEEELKVTVAKAYYNCLIADKRMELLDENIKLLESMETMTRKLYKEGFAEKIDADRFQVQVNNLQTEKDKITNLYELSYMMLKFQMGMPLEQPLKLAGDLSRAEISKDIDVDQIVDYNNRVEMALLQTGKRLNQYDLERYQKGYLPTVVAALSGSYSSQVKDFKELFTLPYFPTGAFVLNASMPIWDGGTRRAKINQAKLNLLKTENDILSFKQGVDLESTNARIQLKNSLMSLGVQEKNIELSRSVYNIAQKKYREGLGSNIEILQAETAYKEAQVNYFNSLYTAAIAKIDYQKALGLIK